ncbi:hypothetical protein HELRODRAFT_63562, partial [Helobdella robusta]|uniref:28S ribosomal protein S14, mitochondrial n=1 Tax=Helobdella robusta TaxID=6412 RepID=T1FXH5_HELRO
QVRTRYINWAMRRDVKRRALATEYAPLRMRLVALKRAKMLPEEIRSHASQELTILPRDSCPNRTVNRCVLTSRPRGVVQTHRLSRIMWRLLADYNKLSGVIRAKW